ncbi:unnamed protein product [Closterium sp. NIES-53]
MAQPEGFDDGSGRVLRLKKALYGLKQVPRQWYLKLRGVLEEIGFTPSTADHSLFMLGEGEQRSFMVVYVDDILIFSPSSDLVKDVMLKVQDKFKCKALGDVSFYLGLHIERDVEKRCMRVHQRKYLEALTANFGQSEGHVATPFPSGFKCVKGPEEESVGEEERCRFHSLVGSLMYAAVNTRPDVAFATGQLARVVQCPNEEQVAAGMRVAKYLGQTPTVGLQYSAAGQRRQKGADGVEPGRLFLTAFSDASYASEPEDMTSVGGFICSVGGGPTAWESKKQVDQALSSVDSEYMALFRAVREILWQRRLLAELGEEQQGPTPLYCDSQGAIALAKNPVLHGLTKHMRWIIDTEVKLRTPIVNLTTTHSSSASLNATQPRTQGGRKGGSGGRGGGGGGSRVSGRGGRGGSGGGGGPGGPAPGGSSSAGGAMSRGGSRSGTLLPCTNVRRHGPHAGTPCGQTNHPPATCFKELDDAWFDRGNTGTPPRWNTPAVSAAPAALAAVLPTAAAAAVSSAAAAAALSAAAAPTAAVLPAAAAAAVPSAAVAAAVDDLRFSIPCTHLSTLPYTAFPSGKFKGLHIHTLRNYLLSHRELQGVGITAIYPGFANYCDLYQTSSGRFLLRIPLCPRTRLYTLRTPRPSFCHVTTRAVTSTGPPPPLPPPQVSPSSGSLPSSLPTSSSTPSPSSSTALSHPVVILHHRLGHPNFAALRTTVTSRLLHSLPPTLPPLPSSPAPPCPSCIHGKLKQSPHHSHPTFAAAPIDLVHMDLWGPYPIRSRQGHRYMLVLVDDHSRYSTVFFLHTKDQVLAVVINWAEQCRNHFRRPIGHLHSDGGGEFINNTLATFCKLHGIQQTSTLPHSPQKMALLRVASAKSPNLPLASLLTPPRLPPFGAMPFCMPPSS